MPESSIAPTPPSHSGRDTRMSRRGGRSSHERRLVGLLRVIGSITLLAFVAAVMPETWIVETAEALGFEPFPHSPLTFYLVRNLSLLYGFVGIGLLVVTIDFERYRPLVRYLAWGTMALGVLQLIVDAQSSLPVWWTLGESTSSFLGGMLIAWLDRAALAADRKLAADRQPAVDQRIND